MNNTVENEIAKIGESLAGLPFDFAFLGGSVLSLLVTDCAIDAIRTTKDVDVMVDARTRRDFHAVERLLEKLGYGHDTREGAPVCRWIYDGITIDVLPVREDVLGWKSKWFEDALTAAQMRPCGGRRVKVVSPPFFVALKLEAFEERGERNFLYSTDFEDVICLFNGRATIADEIARDAALAKPLGGKFKAYLDSPELEDAIDGFVRTEDNPSARKEAILSRFRMVAALADTPGAPTGFPPYRPTNSHPYPTIPSNQTPTTNSPLPLQVPLCLCAENLPATGAEGAASEEADL